MVTPREGLRLKVKGRGGSHSGHEKDQLDMESTTQISPPCLEEI